MRNIFLASVLLATYLAFGQQALPEQDKGETRTKLEVVNASVTTVEPVLDPKTVVNFDQAHLANLNRKPVTIDLDRVTVVEYWSRNANHSNLYWNRMRELEHKYAGSSEIQIISVNYDIALGGARQIKALGEYLKTHTPPKTLYIDRDDGIRDLFALTGAVAYMLFNHHGQYIYSARADDPSTEALFKKIEDTVNEKKRWDTYVARTVEQNSKK